jgi:hypothetical protein
MVTVPTDSVGALVVRTVAVIATQSAGGSVFMASSAKKSRLRANVPAWFTECWLTSLTSSRPIQPAAFVGSRRSR